MSYQSEDIERRKCEYIKRLVQDLSGIPDIGIQSRKRNICDLKKIYCALAKEFTISSLSVIGDVLCEGYGHDSVIYNIREFDNLYLNKQFSNIGNDVYLNAYSNLELLGASFKEVEIKTRGVNPEFVDLLIEFVLKMQTIFRNEHFKNPITIEDMHGCNEDFI